jgi:hypothetical protein
MTPTRPEQEGISPKIEHGELRGRGTAGGGVGRTLERLERFPATRRPSGTLGRFALPSKMSSPDMSCRSIPAVDKA